MTALHGAVVTLPPKHFVHKAHGTMSVTDGIVLATSFTKTWARTKDLVHVSGITHSTMPPHKGTHTYIHTHAQKNENPFTRVWSLFLCPTAFPLQLLPAPLNLFGWVSVAATINGRGRKDGRSNTTTDNSTRSLSQRVLWQDGWGVRMCVYIHSHWAILTLCGLGRALKQQMCRLVGGWRKRCGGCGSDRGEGKGVA